ncbi:MAG: radical SAM protein [Helicobacter sp.]|nr:radical SAM protein [Helicobacter sp.]
MSIIFGPIHSRRFGKTLGVDLSPREKQCNYDCLYCELEGKKAQDSMLEVLSVNEILAAIAQSLKKYPNIQSLSITANGEPTLYPYLYELMLRLEDIKGQAKTLLLTNGSLLWRSEVSKAALLFDKVKFSLDAITQKVFQKIDRPTKTIDLEKILQGICQFSMDFRGELYAEILFVKNVNDSVEEAKKMAKFLAFLPLKRLDIGTIDRPPAYAVKPLGQEELEELAKIFYAYGIPFSLATRQNHTKDDIKNLLLDKEEILKTLALRPMSVEDVQSLWADSTKDLLRDLMEEKKVKRVLLNGVEFYDLDS